MSDKPAPNAESTHQCPVCKRRFAKESTRKRHHYYCRSKQSQPPTSRRRACTACILAKTRCTWTTSIDMVTCSRCHDRGIACEYDTVTGRTVSLEHSNSEVASGATSHDVFSSGLQTYTASVAYNKNVESSLISPEANPTDVHQSTEAFRAALSNSRLEDAMGQLYGLESNIEPVRPGHLRSASRLTNEASDGLTFSNASSIPRSLGSFGSTNFGLRTFGKPSQTPMATFLMRTLRSYTFRILGKETLPPFLSPLLYSRAEVGKGPPQQSLFNCMTLVRMFKSQKKGNRGFIWKLVRIEQERILVEYPGFDRWELLAALQALLVYCLMRLLDDPAAHDSFDAPLLVTTKLVIIAISLSVQMNHIIDRPEGAQPSWEDWIFNESRRRTLLVFGVLLMVVDISAVVSCAPMAGYLLVPIASDAKLWHTTDPEQWRSAYYHCYEEQIVYGLSVSGELMSLQKSEDGILSSPTEWDEWVADVGEIGTLIMMTASLV